MANSECFCPDPPAISNGEVKYAGPYSNGTRAEYDCDAGYTQNGGSSLLCQETDLNCTSAAWVVDSSDSTSATPDCQLPEVIENTYNNVSETVQNLTFSWGYMAPLIVFLILILILLLLLLLCFCCRAYWRNCCLGCCPCCAYCLQENPTTVVPVKPYRAGEVESGSQRDYHHSETGYPNGQVRHPPPTPPVHSKSKGGVMWATSTSGRHSPGGSLSILRYASLQERGLKRSRTDLGLYYSRSLHRKPSVEKHTKYDQKGATGRKTSVERKDKSEPHVSYYNSKTVKEVPEAPDNRQPVNRQRDVFVESVVHEEEVDNSMVSGDDTMRGIETQTYMPIYPRVKKGGIFTQKPIYYGREKQNYRSFGRRYVPSFGSIAPGGMAHSTKDHRRHKKMLGYDPYSMSTTLGKHSSFGKNHHFDSRGQPLWLPHAHQVRKDPNHVKTSTK